MTEINIDLREASLFGNSASEDEEGEIFSSYAIRREEVNRFVSNEKICIIKTLKGCGKSAILRIAKDELDKKGNITILSLKDIIFFSVLALNVGKSSWHLFYIVI